MPARNMAWSSAIRIRVGSAINGLSIYLWNRESNSRALARLAVDADGATGTRRPFLHSDQPEAPSVGDRPVVESVSIILYDGHNEGFFDLDCNLY